MDVDFLRSTASFTLSLTFSVQNTHSSLKSNSSSEERNFSLFTEVDVDACGGNSFFLCSWILLGRVYYFRHSVCNIRGEAISIFWASPSLREMLEAKRVWRPLEVIV